MTKFDKAMNCMRTVIINAMVAIFNMFGVAYLAGELMYDVEPAVIVTVAWTLFSGYQIVMRTLKEVNEVIKYQ